MIYYLNENTEQFDVYDHINSLYEIAYDCQIEMLNINEDAESVKRTVSYYIDRIIQKIKDFFRMIRNKIQEWMRKYSISKLERDIKPTKAGLEGQKLTRYTPKQEIKTAYIDPTYADFGSGSVYVETETPIPVMKYAKKLLDIFKDRKENV